jgi:hypothetical protein
MVYITIFLGLFFMSIGFLVTEKNARYLLSGYNTMTPEEREQFDLKRYIAFFRNFHVLLGLTFAIAGVLITYLWGTNMAGVFLGIYPLLAYMWFAVKSKRFSQPKGTQWNSIMVYVLGATLIFVLGLMYLGFRENRMHVGDGYINVSGIYGIKLPIQQVATAELVNELPDIRLRTNGMSMGSIRKGFYKTASGETVRLIINAETTPYIFIRMNSGEKIYYSSRSRQNVQIINELHAAIGR